MTFLKLNTTQQCFCPRFSDAAYPVTYIYVNYLAAGSLFKKKKKLLRMKAMFKDNWTERYAFILHFKFKTDVCSSQSIDGVKGRGVRTHRFVFLYCICID